MMPIICGSLLKPIKFMVSQTPGRHFYHNLGYEIGNNNKKPLKEILATYLRSTVAQTGAK